MVSGSLSAPVSITIGTCTPASRTRRQSSRPSMSGRPTSRTIVSKRSLLTISKACAAVAHWTQTNSSCSSSCSARDWRNASSSSTIRTLRPVLMIRSVLARWLSARPVQFIPNKQMHPIRSARWLPAGASLRRIECHQTVECPFPCFRRLRPIRQTSARGARPCRQPRSERGLRYYPPQRSRQGRRIARRHEESGLRRHRFGDRPRCRCDHRQAVRHRFRIDHTVALVERRQNESISCSISARNVVRGTLAVEGDAPTKTDRPNQAANGLRRRRIALERSNAAKAPVEIANAVQCFDKKIVALARDEVRYTEQLSYRGAPWPQRAGRLCRPGWDHRDPLKGDAIALDGRGGFAARTEDTADPREQSRLAGGSILCRSWRKTGFPRQRSMDEGDNPQTPRLRRDRFGEIGEGQAVDDSP